MYARAQIVDYLVASGVYEFIFVGSLPKEGYPFQSMYLPFDAMTWILILGSVIILSMMLHMIEWCWKRTTDGTDNLKIDGYYIFFNYQYIYYSYIIYS